MDLSGSPGDPLNPLSRNQRRGIGGSSSLYKNPVNRDRIFVDFFIPPPPPQTSDSETSESDSTSEDSGYEIAGLKGQLDIFDLSEKIVKGTFKERKSKRSGNRHVKKINMNSIFNDSNGEETSSESQEVPPKFPIDSPVKSVPIATNDNKEIQSEIITVESVHSTQEPEMNVATTPAEASEEQ